MTNHYFWGLTAWVHPRPPAARPACLLCCYPKGGPSSAGSWARASTRPSGVVSRVGTGKEPGPVEDPGWDELIECWLWLVIVGDYVLLVIDFLVIVWSRICQDFHRLGN